jgi:hypothetical protein
MAITVKELLQREDFFDAAVLRHGFTDYMRDYEIIIGARNGPPNTDIHKYQFVGCVEVEYHTKVVPHIFLQSLSDEFVYAGPDYPDKKEPSGFIWGVRYSTAYPGLKYLDDGERAQYWSHLMDRKMHEVILETEAFYLRLVFADMRYALLGYEPEVVLEKNYPLTPTENTSDGGRTTL